MLRDANIDAVFSGHLHRYERRTVDGVQTFTVGTGGQGYGSLEHTAVSPGSDISLLDIGALMVDVRTDGTVGYTYRRARQRARPRRDLTGADRARNAAGRRGRRSPSYPPPPRS